MAFGRRGRVSRRFTRLSRSIAAGAGLAAARFPLASVLIVCFSALSNLAIRDRLVPDEDTLVRLLAVLAGAGAASVAARLAVEGRTSDGRVLGLAPPAVALAVGLAIWFGRPLELHAPALVSAAILSVPLAPFILRGTARAFWTFTLWTTVGVTLAFFSVVLFAAGLAAILEMVRYLFGIGLSSDAYGHILTTALTLVGPLFALGRIPRVDEAEILVAKDDRLVQAVRPLFDWVAAPLALATAVILHLYAARILVTGELPRGEIGWIVTFFSALVLGLRIAIDPFLADGAPPARAYARAWALMLVVPVALLAYAAWLRIDAEGFTLERYFLVLGGLATATIVALQPMAKLRGDIRVVAAVPLLLIVLSVVGPFGAAPVVGRSQAGRIAADLAAAGPVAALSELRPAVQARVRSRLSALADAGQLGRILPLLPDGQRQEIATLIEIEGEAAGWRVAEALGLSASVGAAPGNVRTLAPVVSGPVDVGGYDRVVFSRWIAEGAVLDDAAPEVPRMHLQDGDLVVAFAAGEERFALVPSLRDLPDSAFAAEGKPIPAPTFDLVSDGGRRIRVRLESLGTGEDGVTPATGTVTVIYRAEDGPDPSLGGGGDGR